MLQPVRDSLELIKDSTPESFCNCTDNKIYPIEDSYRFYLQEKIDNDDNPTWTNSEKPNYINL